MNNQLRTLDDIIKFSKDYLHLNWEIKINRRLRSTLGQVKRKFFRNDDGSKKYLDEHNVIEFNPEIFEYTLGLRRQIILHEFAHALQYENDGYSTHDSRFRTICRMIGCVVTSEIYDEEEVSKLLRKENNMGW